MVEHVREIVFHCKLTHFERRSVGTHQTLAPFDESLLLVHHASDFDDVTRDVTLQHANRLGIMRTKLMES